jgi:hypothetical protein|tara:strand:- start:122 stop:367 length:246 start_codon:yes stop_codon:yes gene_type:complete
LDSFFRNIDIGYAIVTRQSDRVPELKRDVDWEKRTPGMDALRSRGRGQRSQRASSYGRESGNDWNMSNMSSSKDEGGVPLL